jgi:hypothetical protein
MIDVQDMAFSVQVIASSVEIVSSVEIISSVEIVFSVPEIMPSVEIVSSVLVAVSGCMQLIMAKNKRKRRNIPPRLNFLCITSTPFL